MDVNTANRASLLFFVVAAGAAFGEPDPSAQAESKEKPRILFLAHELRARELRLADKVEKDVKQEGFAIAWHNSMADLTHEFLRQFHAVVVYYHHVAPRPDDRIKNGLGELRRYVKAGGGLLVTKDLYSRRGQDFYRELLNPLEIEILMEQVQDQQNVYRLKTLGTRQHGAFGWTDAITKHPATEGVEGLFYSLGQWEPGEPGVLPLKAGADWQALVRGMPDASTFVPPPVGHSPKARKIPGTYSESPPLLAARSFGKGRVAVWPTLATFTLLDGYSPILENGIVMRGRRGSMRSDGARLTYNLLRWLSEHSLSDKSFGNAIAKSKLKPKQTAEPEELPLGFRTIDWKEVREFGPAFQHAYLGLIGARTSLSTGKGTPDQFIAAAKEVGYEFIVFCEDINEMPKQNWLKLVEACEKGTDEKFRAIPGMYYLDNEGDAFAVLGNIGYPPQEWADPKNPKKKILYNGTIRMAVNPIPPIVMLPLKTNKRPARLHSSFYGYAIQVYEDGNLLAEDWDTYFRLQKEGLGLFPTAVHIVKKPAEVARARKLGMQAYIRADSMDKLLESVDMTSSARGRFFKPAFASSGPEICTMFARNWGTSDLTIVDNDRYRLRMLVRSDKGLAEVRLNDRGRTIRRFLLNGAKEFRKTLDEYHDRQHSFVLVATDVAGGKAVSWDRKTNVQECWFSMCSDNMNDMGPGGKFGFDTGRVHLRGTECKVRLQNPSGTNPFPSMAARSSAGTLRGWGSRHASMKTSALTGRFGLIVSYGLDYYWDGVGRTSAASSSPLAKNEHYGGSFRKYYFARRPPGPNLEIRDYNITIKQDLELLQTPGIALMLGSNWSLSEGALDHVVYFTPDGDCVVEQPTEQSGRQHWSVTARPGEYLAVYPMCTAVYPLEGDLLGFIDRKPLPPRHTLFQVGVGRKGDKLEKGTVIRRRLAVLTLPFAATGQYRWLREYKRYWNSNLLAEDVRRKLGLAGPPAYQVEPSVGAVLDTRLALRLKAEGHGFRARIKRCHLPVPLPVFIEGLHPNWSAGIWYKGRNRLLQTEYPPGAFDKNPVHLQYVQLRAKKDEIIRFGTFDGGTGYLQLDLETSDRDVFIGNLVTCDREDFFLTFHRPYRTGKASVEVHNPTDQAATVRLKPGKGFELLGDFAVDVEVPGGASVMVKLD